MRTLPWDRQARIDELRGRIWRYLTPTVDVEQVILEAAALLQMEEIDVLTLARLHFLLSEEVRDLLAGLPDLVRRLATTTAHEEEWSSERVRGAILWGRTLGARTATGLPHIYVTSPARRAFQTPENELLVFLLDQVVEQGREGRWSDQAPTGIGKTVSERMSLASRWRLHRTLASVERRAPTPRRISRVRMGRHRRAYGGALRAYEVFRSLIAQLDREAVKEAVERRALATRNDGTLFELLCTFELVDALERRGWALERLGLVRGSLRLRGTHQRGGELELWYQRLPPTLSRTSLYASVVARHDLGHSRLRPDLVLRWAREGGPRKWLLVEAKMGTRRTVADSARRALLDLFGYRRDFNEVLADGTAVYGLGVAWGAELGPASGTEVVLTTPDHLTEALEVLGI